jgi:hypothetical protein
MVPNMIGPSGTTTDVGWHGRVSATITSHADADSLGLRHIAEGKLAERFFDGSDRVRHG